MRDLNKCKKLRTSIKNTQGKISFFILKKFPHYKYTFSMRCCFLYSFAFLLEILCGHIAGKILVPLDIFLFLFMMNMNFWSVKHYSDQSFSNKCDCTRQVNIVCVCILRFQRLCLRLRLTGLMALFMD